MTDYEKRIEQRYTDSSGQAYHTNKRSIPDVAYPWVARLRAEKIAPFVNAADTVFEYGVGTGWNLAALECKRKMGFDLATHLEQDVQSHGIEFLSDVDQIPTGSVDVVVCHHVLEHTPNPGSILEKMRSLLRSGGRLLLFVPFEKEQRYCHYNPTEPNHHIYSWNVQTLGNLVADYDYIVDEAMVGRFGYDRFGSVWAVRCSMGERAYRLVRRLVHVVAPMVEVRIAARKP